jgi:toxin HigB-1
MSRCTQRAPALNAAVRPEDLNVFAGHWLKGDRRMTYAVTVRANWRITFKWDDGKWDDGAVPVDLEDYHGK